MRIFIALLLFLPCFSFASLGSLQVYVFDADGIPEKTRVFVKKNELEKPQMHHVYMGALSLDLETGSVFISTKKTGVFTKVFIFENKKSQISFDISKKKTFIAKHDDFKKKLDFTNEDLVSVSGQVLSSESGAGVSDASLFIAGTSLVSKTDSKGNFEIQIPKNIGVSLSVVHEDYRLTTLENVTYENSLKGLNFSLLPAMGEMSEIVVLAPKTKGSIESLLKERRALKSVSVSIGSEQFKKSGDSDAGSALKRVSGLSLVEGKYVYIRGLGERYSSTSLNGVSLPSPNPSRRVVPLDLFPTSLIESILIQKSYSADKPAQFSAGLVEIRTLSIPKKKSYFKISASTGVSNENILKGVQVGNFHEGGGKSDRLGWDDGFRALPKDIRAARASGRPITFYEPPVDSEDDDWDTIWEDDGDGGFDDLWDDASNRFALAIQEAQAVEGSLGFSGEELASLGSKFSSSYETQESKVGPNLGLSFEGGRSFEFGTQKTGFILKGLYSRTNDFDLERRNSFALGIDNELVQLTEETIIETTSQFRTGGVLSFGLDLWKRTKIDVTGLGTRATVNETEIYVKDAGSDEESSFRATRLNWQERELLNFQVRGEQSFFENHKGPKLDWFWSRSLSSTFRPDNRDYKYFLNTNEFIDDANGNERTFADLNDEANEFNLKLSGAQKLSSWLKVNALMGVRDFKKSRLSTMERFKFVRTSEANYDPTSSISGIINEDNINSQQIRLQDSSRNEDNYKASENNVARYFQAGLEFQFSDTSSLSLDAGVRHEDHEQFGNTFSVQTGVDANDFTALRQKENFDTYSAVYKINDRASFRSGYSQTVARPDLQEFLPVVFFDDSENIFQQGNPDLKISEIENIDLRFDYYFNRGEFASVGFFRKNIFNPIEAIPVAGTDDSRVTFQNIKGAKNDGLELEFRKHLFKGLFLNGNYSYIQSEVQIEKNDTQVSTSTNRPLQGQSPYLVNFGLDYASKAYGFNLAAVYNRAGKRISVVGDSGLPDVYEQPFDQLDFTLSQELSKKTRMTFKAQNILNPLSERTQGGESVRAVRYGRRYSLTFTSAI